MCRLVGTVCLGRSGEFAAGLTAPTPEARPLTSAQVAPRVCKEGGNLGTPYLLSPARVDLLREAA